MNRLQKAFLVCGLVGVVAICLYPPWDHDLFRQGGWRWTETGHGWIFNPPSPPPSAAHVAESRIAFSRLGVEAAAVVGITAVGIVLAGWRKTAKP